MPDQSGRTPSCVYCRQPICWEDTEYAKRWVHEASGIPMCTATVATPVVSLPSCYCGEPDDRERVHRSHECLPWVSRG